MVGKDGKDERSLPAVRGAEDALSSVGFSPVSIPEIVQRAGAGGAYADFFLARYGNEHTRRAYKRIVDRFLDWVDRQGAELSRITPRMCGVYRDRVRGAPASKKQMLAALRGFFDFLVERHFCLVNPARSTRNPREQVEEGKTPEIPTKEVEKLIASVDASTLVGLRDRAVIAAWAATGARVGAIAKLRLGNFHYRDRQWYLELDEKNSKHREIPCRHDLERFVVAYLVDAGIQGDPATHHIFRTAEGRTGRLTAYEPEVDDADGMLLRESRGMMTADDMRRMLKRRLTDAGFGERSTRRTPAGHAYTRYESLYSPHSFRVMVVTDLLAQQVDIHDVAYLAGHTSTRTTQGYDRTRREVKRNLVERIRVNLAAQHPHPED